MAHDECEVVAIDEGSAQRREDDAHSNGNKHETRGTRGITLADLKDDGVCDEKHVQQAIQHRHVKADEKHNQFAEEELERADEENTEALGEGPRVELGFADVAGVVGLLAELGGASREDGGRVCLGNGESDEHPDDEGEDELDPIQPTPAGGV